jgi:hypothetical protein
MEFLLTRTGLGSVSEGRNSLELNEFFGRTSKMLAKAAGVPHGAMYLLSPDDCRLERRSENTLHPVQ